MVVHGCARFAQDRQVSFHPRDASVAPGQPLRRAAKNKKPFLTQLLLVREEQPHGTNPSSKGRLQSVTLLKIKTSLADAAVTARNNQILHKGFIY